MITVTCHTCVLQWRFADTAKAAEFRDRHYSLQHHQWHHLTTGLQCPVVLLCQRCGRPFQTDVIRALCGACQRAQEARP